MEYRYPIETFKFKPAAIHTPNWITLDIGKEFEIHILEDINLPGYIFCVLVLPEKIDPDDGGIFMQEFKNRFYNTSDGETYSILKEEFELSRLPDLVNFEIKPIDNPRNLCGLYMQINGSTYFGCAPLWNEDRLYSYDVEYYHEHLKNGPGDKKEKLIEKKFDELDDFESGFPRGYNIDE